MIQAEEQVARYANPAELVPEPCRVAGTRLLPFCLGHHLLFRRFGLPFAGSPDADCSHGEILVGILITAQTYESTLTEIHDDTWDKTQSKWLVAVAKRQAKLKQSIEDIEKRFRSYLRTGYKQPPVCKQASGGVRLSAPWECLLMVGLARAGFSEAEVLNGYLPARWYQYFTAMELTASETCDDPKRWRTIFHSAAEAEQIRQAKAEFNGNEA